MSVPFKILSSGNRWHGFGEEYPLDDSHSRPAKNSREIAIELLAELASLPLSKLQQRVGFLERTVEQQGSTLARIEKMLLEPDPVAPRDKYAVWAESKDAAKYAGMFVAFTSEEGPIESAPTLKELRAKIKANLLAKKAAIVTVPNAVF